MYKYGGVLSCVSVRESVEQWFSNPTDVARSRLQAKCVKWAKLNGLGVLNETVLRRKIG